jgi:DNA oxidative demethylase
MKTTSEQLTLTLPERPGEPEPQELALAPGAVVLRGFALAGERTLLADVERVVAAAPLRHLVTRGGFRMSVAMTNCGALGWVSDLHGYRYDPLDPDSGLPWPPMPASLLQLATAAAARAGFASYRPDACLVNRYAPGARLTLHQDRNEHDLEAPIVSVSLGIPAVFLFGGLTRKERPLRVPLRHGDVAVWGGPARMRFHGVLPIEAAHHPATGSHRINLTFRQTR